MCELCGRPSAITKHHLIPRSRKKREREEFGPTADLCRDCHRKCHATYNNATLAREYSTVEKLKVAAELQSYLKWIKKQSPTQYFGSKSSKDTRD